MDDIVNNSRNANNINHKASHEPKPLIQNNVSGTGKNQINRHDDWENSAENCDEFCQGLFVLHRSIGSFVDELQNFVCNNFAISGADLPHEISHVGLPFRLINDQKGPGLAHDQIRHILEPEVLENLHVFCFVFDPNEKDRSENLFSVFGWVNCIGLIIELRAEIQLKADHLAKSAAICREKKDQIIRTWQLIDIVTFSIKFKKGSDCSKKRKKLLVAWGIQFNNVIRGLFSHFPQFICFLSAQLRCLFLKKIKTVVGYWEFGIRGRQWKGKKEKETDGSSFLVENLINVKEEIDFRKLLEFKLLRVF